jgi:hypothetical protein
MAPNTPSNIPGKLYVGLYCLLQLNYTVSQMPLRYKAFVFVKRDVTTRIFNKQLYFLDFQLEDFRSALPKVRTSIKPEMLASLEEWNKKYGDVS